MSVSGCRNMLGRPHLRWSSNVFRIAPRGPTLVVALARPAGRGSVPAVSSNDQSSATSSHAIANGSPATLEVQLDAEVSAIGAAIEATDAAIHHGITTVAAAEQSGQGGSPANEKLRSHGGDHYDNTGTARVVTSAPPDVQVTATEAVIEASGAINQSGATVGSAAPVTAANLPASQGAITASQTAKPHDPAAPVYDVARGKRHSKEVGQAPTSPLIAQGWRDGDGMAASDTHLSRASVSPNASVTGTAAVIEATSAAVQRGTVTVAAAGANEPPELPSATGPQMPADRPATVSCGRADTSSAGATAGIFSAIEDRQGPQGSAPHTVEVPGQSPLPSMPQHGWNAGDPITETAASSSGPAASVSLEAPVSATAAVIEASSIAGRTGVITVGGAGPGQQYDLPASPGALMAPDRPHAPAAGVAGSLRQGLDGDGRVGQAAHEQASRPAGQQAIGAIADAASGAGQAAVDTTTSGVSQAVQAAENVAEGAVDVAERAGLDAAGVVEGAVGATAGAVGNVVEAAGTLAGSVIKEASSVAGAAANAAQRAVEGVRVLAAPEYRRRSESRAPRPLLPLLNPQQLLEALTGEPAVQPQLQELFKMYEAGSGPRIYAPTVSKQAASVDASTLPLLYYLPGIDGTGLAAYRQFPALSSAFDLRAMFLPPQDRTTFEGLVDWLVVQLEDQAERTPDSRPIYLLGESFGALLALAAAQRCSAVDRVVVCNPATNFADSVWPLLGPALPNLPEPLYRLLPIALSPILTNPVAVAANNVDERDSIPQQLSDLAYGLLDLLPELSSLRLVLPPDTLAWRLQLLQHGAAYVRDILPKVPQRVLVVAGERDAIIPSANEEAGVDLVAIMRDEGFYVRERVLTTHAPAAAAAAKAAASRAASHNGNGSTRHAASPPSKRKGANFGAAAPLELPTRRELDKAAEAGGLRLLRQLVSPVFYSTGADGAVVQGLAGVPQHDRPLLFVGPHSLFAPDMPLMVEELLRQRGMLVRGLAHPVALQGIPNKEDSSSTTRSNPFGNFLQTFGAVPVNGKNFHRLLTQGEAVLLYPGGVREAYKLKNEKYTIIWPSRTEFVRMAARFGATIVPFAHIGAEDGVNQVLDARELLSLPIIGDALRKSAAKVPSARSGVSVSEDVVETFVQPLITLNPPSRFYYLFGKPFETRPEMANDKKACDKMYQQIKSEVQGGLSYLQRKRQQDPYKDLPKRLFYEFAWGGNKTAPSFMP